MKYKFFRIPVCDQQQAENELNAFCSQHRITHTEKHFVMDGANSFWSICITWLEGETAPTHSTHQRKPIVDYKEILSDENFSFYLELRNFRKELAEKKAVPPYALFTNEQLAKIVERRVGTKKELESIPGVGKSRIEKYADDFLNKANSLWADQRVGKEDEKSKD